MKTYIEKYTKKLSDGLSNIDCGAFSKVVSELNNTRKKGGVIYICGNGGSAATASHFMNDLNKLASSEYTKPFKSIALTDNVPLMTAWGNDESYEEVFESQLKNFISSEDLVIGISGSGNSANVVNAVKYSNEVGAKTIAFLGFDGGQLAKYSDHNIHFEQDHYGRVEDAHMIFVHIITNYLREVN